jgi:uncharacterized membrane protein
MSGREEFKEQIKRGVIFAAGMAAGARCMYMLDPDLGRRRRALVCDRVTWVFHHTQRTLDKSLRDLGNRLQGLVANTTSLLMPERVPDEVLIERVRTRLGRVVSHPGAIEVAVKSGIVTLSGPVFEDEAPRLLWAVRSMRDVLGVENRLKLHRSAEGVPGLQGPERPRRQEFELLREEWAPATRLVVGTSGGLLLAAGATRRGLLGAGLGLLGTGLILRSLTNRAPGRLLGLTEREAAGIQVQKTLTIHAAPEKVFELLADPEKFPRIMSHIQEVKKVAERRYRWTVVGPLNAPLSWESEITDMVSNKLLAWRSVPGAVVENSGLVQVSEAPGEAARVHIRLKYNPPAGELGNAIAWLFDSDLKRVLDRDFASFKSLMEQGRTTAHHHRVTLAEVAG